MGLVPLSTSPKHLSKPTLTYLTKAQPEKPYDMRENKNKSQKR